MQVLTERQETTPTEKRDEALKQALLNIFFTDTIGSCHVENAVEFLRPLPNDKIGPVLRLVKLIACSVSDLLAFSFMENVERALSFLSVDQLEEWVTEALSIYESKGLHPARDFFSNPQETTLRYGGERRVATLEETSLGLSMLACGLSGKSVVFKPSRMPSTDTETIWMPGSFSLFPSRQDNRLFFRVCAIHKCAQIRYKSFLCPEDRLKGLFPELKWPEKGERPPAVVLLLRLLKEQFPETDVEACFCLADLIRLEQHLSREFKGIARDMDLFKRLILERYQGEIRGLSGPVGELVRFIIYGFKDESLIQDPDIRGHALALCRPESSVLDTFCLVRQLLLFGPIDFSPVSRLLPHVGSLNLGALDTKIRQRRKELEENFVQILGSLVAKADKHQGEAGGEAEEPAKGAGLGLEDVKEALAMIISGAKKEERDEALQQELISHLQLQGNEELLEKLAEVSREIVQDLGQIPSFYVSSALDLATGLYDPRLCVTETEDQAPAFSFHSYPEWDFRRSDYRQNWCTLKEMTAKGSSGSFVRDVLKTYKGQVEALRRQFEMIRQDYKVVKRQRDGQEVDIDAFVEAYTDLKARLSPSENLYHRLIQNRRDIAVLFLVDMSASTEGWINRAIKESLVLLSTAMECVGDQYSIFGFSGMRRTGCQYFVIKDFKEEFSYQVKARITGISPKDYTRMGPAIRHSTEKLKEVDARVKILLTLSDGKPEDYDEYKGPYAIEDTRMALFEARQQGIKPFCITIDKEARQYLPRMYGAANFVLVPDVKLLHKRVPEIYRILTT